MPAILRHRLFLPVMLGVVAIAVVAFLMSSGSDGPTLTEARLDPRTDTVTDLADPDGSDDAAGPGFDDREEAGERTETATDTVDEAASEPVAGELTAALAVDDADACVWLVNVTGENPASLFLAAWPTGTTISWEPFAATLPTSDGDLVIDQRQQLELVGTVVDTIGELASPELDRLLGQERCGHDGIVIFEQGAVVTVR